MENEILNFSRVENDPFAEIPLNIANSTASPEEIYVGWHPSTFHIIMNYIFMALEIIKFFLGLGAMLADILLIYLILRYKRLRTNFNMYIVHYAIMNIAYYLISPLFLLFHALFMTGFNFFFYMYCFVSMMEITFLYSSFTFAFFLGIEWTLSCFQPDFMKKIPFIYKYKISIIYAATVLLTLYNSLSCMLGFERSTDILFFFMPFMTIALVVMHRYRRQKVLSSEHLKTEYSLWISTIAIGCYIPIYFMDITYRFIDDFTSTELALVVFLFEYLFALFSVPGPIFIMYYLNKWNKHIKMAYDTTFKKSVRTYGSDNLDDASDNEEIVEDSGEKNTQSHTDGSVHHTIMVP